MNNKTVKILITALILLVSLGAQAYTLTRAELEKNIKTQIQTQAQKQINNIGSADIEIKILNLPYTDIETKNKAVVKVESNRNGFLYRDIKRVSIYDGETFVKSFPISVNTLVYKYVLCATNPIVRGQTINASNTSVIRTEIGKYIGQTINDFPKNPLVAQRNLSKGTAVLEDYVKSKPDVLKDSIVNIVFSSNGNLSIRVDGKALKEGSIGDNILVRSTKYNKVYQATVSNKNEVTVKI